MTPGERFGECWLDQFDLNDAPPPPRKDDVPGYVRETTKDLAGEQVDA